MNRIFRLILCPEVFLKSQFGRFSRSVGNIPKVKIVADEDDDLIKISFRYGKINQNNVNLVAPKQEELESVLSKIKLVCSLHRQREELRRAVVSKYSGDAESFENVPVGEVDVSVIRDDQLLESSVPNIEAWTQGTLLKIGQCIYEVDRNAPCVVALSIPTTILADCAIRPHFIFECAKAHKSRFVWYRSMSQEEVEAYEARDPETEDVQKVNDVWWFKVHEGLLYWTAKEDIGRKLRLVCTPRLGGRSGHAFGVESADVVVTGPESFPFEERHLYTKDLTEPDSIRCLTYNILANVYVEAKKFPYCSQVARDIYYRKQLLVRELLGYNGDILCLQEVQGRIFEYDLLPILQKAGFDGFYVKKGGRRHEGLAVFFRTSKFKVVVNEGVLLKEVIKDKSIFMDVLTKVSGNFKDMSKLMVQDTALQVVLLEDVDNPRRKIIVANTHLYSNKDTPEVRLIQSALCVHYIEHVLKTQHVESTAVLFCGDFNSLPESSALEFLLKGCFECCASWKNNAAGSVTDTTLRHSLSLDSACGFPAYTNYTETFTGCLDYIFYNKNFFAVSEVVPLPSHESVSQHVGLPSELFPSDHIPLICTLQWK